MAKPIEFEGIRTGARMDTLELVGLIIIVILIVVSYALPDDED